MISDSEKDAIRKIILRKIENKATVLLNGELDSRKLPSAIAEAVVEAIAYYDQLRN